MADDFGIEVKLHIHMFKCIFSRSHSLCLCTYVHVCLMLAGGIFPFFSLRQDLSAVAEFPRHMEDLKTILVKVSKVNYSTKKTMANITCASHKGFKYFSISRKKNLHIHVHVSFIAYHHLLSLILPQLQCIHDV